MNFRFPFKVAILSLIGLFTAAMLITSCISNAQENGKMYNFPPVSGAAALIKSSPGFSDRAPSSSSQSFLLLKPLAATNWQNIPVCVKPKPQNETSIVVSPADPLNLVGVWNDNQRSTDTQLIRNAGYGYTTNGAISWQTGLITSPYDNQFDPSIAADKNGNFYYCFAAQDTGPWYDEPGGIFVAKANAATKGATWGTPVAVVEHPTYPSPHFEDKPYISVDAANSIYAGNIYVGWTRFSTAQTIDTTRILFTKSTNGGDNFNQNYIQLDKAVSNPRRFLSPQMWSKGPSLQWVQMVKFM